MRVRANQDFRTYVSGTPLRVTAGSIWTGGAARAMLATHCPVTDLDAEATGPDDDEPDGHDSTGEHGAPGADDSAPDGSDAATADGGNDGDPADPPAGVQEADAEPTEGEAPAAETATVAETEEAPTEAADAVPDGNVSDVLDWVDGDAEKARQALDVERGRERPRAGLVKQLTQIVE
ncbi:hypothetical protein [Glycomyces artemisiae]|uniref:Uncharacterized protein n=1 Tax=Glycomyces artemisiae TaxID=1076443 RepID=A0A2T0UEZ1_9ACTN|nr:hypothetical protein [Glycomyces artemisiae]PRY56444.1 hypothetical protein B0I28_10993 [Glycomyces artemisiae]